MSDWIEDDIAEFEASRHMPPNEQLTEFHDKSLRTPSDLKILKKLLADIVEAFDAGQLQMNSPEIQIGDEPPHPWHEEWLGYARAAMAD